MTLEVDKRRSLFTLPVVMSYWTYMIEAFSFFTIACTVFVCAATARTSLRPLSFFRYFWLKSGNFTIVEHCCC